MRFTPRPLGKINRDLERLYGLPIDAAVKMGGLAAVANALNDGDPARACIAAVFLGLRDVPVRSPQAFMKCAMALCESGLLKAAPDDPVHPGYPAGTEGGRGGQFHPKSDPASAAAMLTARQQQEAAAQETRARFVSSPVDSTEPYMRAANDVLEVEMQLVSLSQHGMALPTLELATQPCRMFNITVGSTIRFGMGWRRGSVEEVS